MYFVVEILQLQKTGYTMSNLTIFVGVRAMTNIHTLRPSIIVFQVVHALKHYASVGFVAIPHYIIVSAGKIKILQRSTQH